MYVSALKHHASSVMSRSDGGILCHIWSHFKTSIILLVCCFHMHSVKCVSVSRNMTNSDCSVSRLFPLECFIGRLLYNDYDN